MSVMEGEVQGLLVDQAALGDEAAFARIVAACHDDMARVCFVVCRDTDLAQEATQAAWPIAWRKLDSIRDPERLRPWLIAIAANEARQLMRRRRRQALRETFAAPHLRGAGRDRFVLAPVGPGDRIVPTGPAIDGVLTGLAPAATADPWPGR